MEARKKTTPAKPRATRAKKTPAAPPTAAALRALAVAEYRRDEANAETAYPYSPARATTAVAEASGIPASRLVALVAGVYYVENGTRSPISFPKRRTDAAIGAAIRKRRDARGRLGRWEVVAVSASAGLGTPVSVAAVRRYYDLAGGDLEASYTGRGTRVGAPKTRTDEVAEIPTDA